MTFSFDSIDNLDLVFMSFLVVVYIHFRLTCAISLFLSSMGILDFELCCQALEHLLVKLMIFRLVK